MSAVVIDTHVVVWMLMEPVRLSLPAHSALTQAIQTGNYIYIPAISIVELIYLIEKQRISNLALTRLQQELLDPATGMLIAPLELGTALEVQNIPREIVPELPDRIIAATAAYMGLPLITRDQTIRASAVTTIW